MKRFLIILFVVLPICGCVSSTKTASYKKSESRIPDRHAAPQNNFVPSLHGKVVMVPDQNESVRICRKALDSLHIVDPEKATKLKGKFNLLVAAATQYSNVRGQVNDSTRQAVDAMYQFQTIRLCNRVNQALMEGLVNRGEGAMK